MLRMAVSRRTSIPLKLLSISVLLNSTCDGRPCMHDALCVTRPSLVASGDSEADQDKIRSQRHD